MPGQVLSACQAVFIDAGLTVITGGTAYGVKDIRVLYGLLHRVDDLLEQTDELVDLLVSRKPDFIISKEGVVVPTDPGLFSRNDLF